MKERTLPIDSTFNVVTFDLLIEGKAIDSAYQVMSIAIMKEVNRVPWAKIVLRDGDPAAETFAISEKESYTPGKKIVVKLGRDRKNTMLFRGIITKHAIRLRENGASELSLECRDECTRMTIGRHNGYFEERKDSEVMEELIRKYPGLSADVESTSLKHKELVQFHCTDWDFMLYHADINWKLVVADDGKIQIKAPDPGSSPSVALLHGSTMLEFEAEMDARTQLKSVEAKSWDYGGQQLFQHKSDSAPVAEPGNLNGAALADSVNISSFELRHSGQVLEAELQEWTKSVMLRSRLAKVRGSARFVGLPDIKPGQMVELQGVGDRFNGKAFISAVRHDVFQGSWHTSVQFGLSPDCFHLTTENILDSSAAGLLPGVHGLQIGKVVQLQNDPDGEHRILVRLPVVDNAAQGTWARMASLDAGNDRGAFFRPEIDDEVVVGFINGDPRDAVVLGMLNSSAKPAPITVKDTNHEKGFFTRSKMRVHFHDETKTITIDTPAGNSIELDEKGSSITIKDQNGNSTIMKPAGIEMKSKGNISIEASGKIDIKAGAALTISAAQMTLSAQGPMEVKGATAKLSSPGITEISGSLVKIN